MYVEDVIGLGTGIGQAWGPLVECRLNGCLHANSVLLWATHKVNTVHSLTEKY